MRFRPCIDIHNGKVKQIVGRSLRDRGDQASENFVSERDAQWYARLYASDRLRGGHVIMLNPIGSKYYEATKQQALAALKAAPGLLQAGGGIIPENAGEFLDAGASHVIVTSYVFHSGELDPAALDRMLRAVGKEHLVLDLSCAKDENGVFRIVTDRWQKMTDLELNERELRRIAGDCDEFLVHAADSEGKQSGPQAEVLKILGSYARSSADAVPVTYAGGIASMADIEKIRTEGAGKVDFTVGSALDLFGGGLSYRELACFK